METDFTVIPEGTISLLRPNSDAAREWIAEHLPEDCITWGRKLYISYVIEHRYISDIVHGIINDGLSICDINDQELDQERH